MILASSATFERTDGQGIYESLKKIASNSPVINESKGWNGFNILHEQCGQINALELGITPRLPKKSPKVVFLLGADNHLNSKDIPTDAFVIYIGSHGDEGAYFADLVLPSAAYLEKNATYVSTEGRV
jgi:NADH dehydrogenase (ubiquinone) Fe-S protein 1